MYYQSEDIWQGSTEENIWPQRVVATGGWGKIPIEVLQSSSFRITLLRSENQRQGGERVLSEQVWGKIWSWNSFEDLKASLYVGCEY